MERDFIEMINANRGMLFKVCNLYFHEEEDKKDLLQEIVLQLWKSFPAFRNESKKTTWMYRVALNTAISNFRKQSRKPGTQPLSLQEFSIPDFADTTSDEKVKRLQLATDQLTKIEKALLMCYLEEKTYQEISEILGITTGNAGVKLNRIKIKLEKIIKSTTHEYN